jgi:hypothetical protein
MPVNPTQVRLHCVDKMGTSVGALSDAVLQSVRWELNGPGYIRYIMPQTSPHILIPEEHVNEVQLWIRRNGVETLRHWGFHHQTTEEVNQCTFTCPGLLGYMGQRFVTNTSLSYGYNDDHSPKDEGIDQELIAGQVWSAKAYDLNIGVDAFDHGTPRYRFYDIFAHQNILTDILGEFPNLADDEGFPTGFDFDIDISDPPARNFIAFHAGKGSLRSDLVLRYGTNVTAFSRSIRGENHATEVYVTGGSNGDIKFENFATSSLEVLDKYGHWEAVKTRSNENDFGVLGELAQRYISQLQIPPADLSVTVVETDDMPLLDLLTTGDQIPVIIDRGRTQVDEVKRITAIEWRPGPGNLTLELGPINQIVEA